MRRRRSRPDPQAFAAAQADDALAAVEALGRLAQEGIALLLADAPVQAAQALVARSDGQIARLRLASTTAAPLNRAARRRACRADGRRTGSHRREPTPSPARP